ncbi:hypothetical protein ACIRU3_19265 [Streptomyces sp. NPDC101151]|uniref:hypothetical protein n=1 Tax=Streptomyces sp. NPDC101151 TaxID=3366115 RepID=UPI0037FE1EBE
MDLPTGLRERRGTTLVLIGYGLRLVADGTDTVTVLEAGRVSRAVRPTCWPRRAILHSFPGGRRRAGGPDQSRA